MRRLPLFALVVAAALLVAVPAVAKKKKKRRAAHRPTPTPRAIAGPPAPTPSPLLRAAGSCLSYEPGQFILLAEVGQHGRMFRIGPETVFKAEPRRGARLRLIYVETAEGPVAREVLPGPQEQ